MSEPLIGQIIVFAGNFAPSGWAMCNGQLLSISQNTALFSVLGTTYGGDGQTTFALPDFRGRVSVGAGQGAGLSFYAQGEVGGTESIGLVASQVPGHGHGLQAAATVTTATPGSTTVLGTVETTVPAYVPASTTGATALSPSSISAAGSGVPHENRQPFLALNYIIALFGIFPSQN